MVEKVATVSKAAEGCELLIKGTFPNMAHDPISYLFRGESELNATFLLPSIQGEHAASQIVVTYGGKTKRWPVKQLVGTVSFLNAQVKIDLVQVDAGQRRPLHFNGTYALIDSQNCTSNHALHPTVGSGASRLPSVG